MLLVAFGLAGCDDSSDGGATFSVVDGPVVGAKVFADGEVVGTTGADGTFEADLSGLELPVVVTTKGGTLDGVPFAGSLKGVITDADAPRVNLTIFTTLMAEMVEDGIASADPETARAAVNLAKARVQNLAAQFGVGMDGVDIESADAASDPAYALAQTMLIAAAGFDLTQDDSYTGEGLEEALENIADELDQPGDPVTNVLRALPAANAAGNGAFTNPLQNFVNQALKEGLYGVKDTVKDDFDDIDDADIDGAEFDQNEGSAFAAKKIGFVSISAEGDPISSSIAGDLSSPVAVSLEVEDAAGNDTKAFVRVTVDSTEATYQYGASSPVQASEDKFAATDSDGDIEAVLDLSSYNPGDALVIKVVVELREGGAEEGAVLDTFTYSLNARILSDSEPYEVDIDSIADNGKGEIIEGEKDILLVPEEEGDGYIADVTISAGVETEATEYTGDQYAVNFIAPAGAKFTVGAGAEAANYDNYMVDADNGKIDDEFTCSLSLALPGNAEGEDVPEWFGKRLTVKAQVWDRLTGKAVTPAIVDSESFYVVDDADVIKSVKLTVGDKASALITANADKDADPEETVSLGELKATFVTWRSFVNDDSVGLPAGYFTDEEGAATAKLVTNAPDESEAVTHGFNGLNGYGDIDVLDANTTFAVGATAVTDGVVLTDGAFDGTLAYNYATFGDDGLNSDNVDTITLVFESADGEESIASNPVIIKFEEK